MLHTLRDTRFCRPDAIFPPCFAAAIIDGQDYDRGTFTLHATFPTHLLLVDIYVLVGPAVFSTSFECAYAISSSHFILYVYACMLIY